MDGRDTSVHTGAGAGAASNHPRLARTAFDVAYEVAALYPLDFGTVLMLTSKSLYHDPGLVRAVVNAPSSPSVLHLVLWQEDMHCRGMRDKYVNLKEKKKATTGRMLEFIRAATPQTLNKEHNGRTALMEAVEALCPDAIRALLSSPHVNPHQLWPARPPVGAEDEDDDVAHEGDNAFVVVCRQTRLQAGLADISASNKEEYSRAQACALLLAATVTPDSECQGRSHFAWAVRGCLPDVVQRMLPHTAADALNVVCEVDGFTPFTAACGRAFGASPEEKHMRTQLIACAQALVDSGKVDPSVTDIQQCTQIHAGAQLGIPSLLKPLLEDPRCTPEVLLLVNDMDGVCSFESLCVVVKPKEQEGECARMMAASGKIAPEAVCSDGGTIVSWAAYAGFVEALEVLLNDPRCPPDIVHRVNNSGHTPLYRLCYVVHQDKVARHLPGREACVQLLASKGALGPSSPAVYGNRPVHLIYMLGMPDVLQTMLADPANDHLWSVENYYGVTPFSAACKAAHHRRSVQGFDFASTELTPADQCVILLANSGKIQYFNPYEVQGDLVISAAMAGSPEALTVFTRQSGWNEQLLRNVRYGGHNPLYAACDPLICYRPGSLYANRYAECARMLASKGALKLQFSLPNGATPAHMVCMGGLSDLLAQVIADPAYFIPGEEGLQHPFAHPAESGLSKQRHTPFSLACMWAIVEGDGGVPPAIEGDYYDQRHIHAERRKVGADCALLIAKRGLITPSDNHYNNGSSVLMAARAGLPDVLQLLLESPAYTPDLAARPDSEGVTPLAYVVRGVVAEGTGRIEGYCDAYKQCARLLASKGALCIISPLVDGMSPAHLVAQARLPDLMQQILSDPLYTPSVLALKDVGGDTAFTWTVKFMPDVNGMDARYEGRAECAGLLACSGKIDPATLHIDGTPYVHMAAQACAIVALHALLNHPACTPELVQLATASHGNILFTSAREGAVNSVDYEKEAYEACLRLLAAKGALSVHMPSNWGMTPLHSISESGHIDLLQQMLADPAWTPEMMIRRDNSGRTALATALYSAPYVYCDVPGSGAAECALLLARTGLYAPGEVDEDGCTHIVLAAKALAHEVIAVLLDQPCFAPDLVVQRDKHGKVPLQYVLEAGGLENRYAAATACAQLLVDRMLLSWTKQAARGIMMYSYAVVTPLCWLAVSGLYEVFSSLLSAVLSEPVWIIAHSALGEGQDGNLIFIDVCRSVFDHQGLQSLDRVPRYNALWAGLSAVAARLVSAGLVRPEATEDEWYEDAARLVSAGLVRPEATEDEWCEDGAKAGVAAATGAGNATGSASASASASAADAGASGSAGQGNSPTTGTTFRPIALALAARAGFTSAVRQLLADPRCTPQVVQQKDGTGKTALQYAAAASAVAGSAHWKEWKDACGECASLLRSYYAAHGLQLEGAVEEAPSGAGARAAEKEKAEEKAEQAVKDEDMEQAH